MTSDTSVLGLMLDASIPVMLVMVLLVIASLMSWSIIFAKRKLIRRTKDSSDEFEASFWSGGDLNTLYQAAAKSRGGVVGMASIFEAGVSRVQSCDAAVRYQCGQGRRGVPSRDARSADA